ncbi:MAG: porin family protein [Desulfuromonadaceae bacterium]|nr:porin family protein [Desulfuromonadaceae bacterium]
MRKVILLTTLTIILATGTAMAASIDGRFGITGKAGVLIPLRDNFISSTSESKTAFAFGGGLIYGFGKNFAAELDVTHVPKLDVEISGSKVFEASFTDLSLGIQYRFIPENRLVPYLGIGADFIKGELTNLAGSNYDMDWTAGGHVNAGLDYFINRSIAFNVDFRGVYTAKGDIKNGDLWVGEYDPMSFICTAGFRFFLPESAFK